MRPRPTCECRALSASYRAHRSPAVPVVASPSDAAWLLIETARRGVAGSEDDGQSRQCGAGTHTRAHTPTSLALAPLGARGTSSARYERHGEDRGMVVHAASCIARCAVRLFCRWACRSARSRCRTRCSRRSSQSSHRSCRRKWCAPKARPALAELARRCTVGTAHAAPCRID
jgi:hypothetical protein